MNKEEAEAAAKVADVLTGRHRAWIKAYEAELASEIGYDIDLMAAAKDYLETGEYVSTGDSQIELSPEFWDHYEAVVSAKVDEDKRWSFFTCAC